MKQKSSEWTFWPALVCSGTAIAIHGYLANHHLQLQYGASDGSSICNINQVFNCDSVNSSQFSELFGVPLGLWGATTNLALLLLLVWGQLTRYKDDHIKNILRGIGSLIALASVVMGGISLVYLSEFCLFCLVTYGLSFVGLWAVWKLGSSERLSQTFIYLFRRGDSGGLSYLVFLATIPVLTFLLNGMMRSSYGSNFSLMVEESFARWSNNTVQKLDTTEALHLKNPQASYVMTIVEFADFRCSHCRHAAPSLHAFANSRKDVQFSFLNFPLDSRCNSAINGVGVTCPMAKALLCANKNGQGWEVHDWLFESITNDPQILLSELEANTGLALKDCVDGKWAQEVAMSQASQGQTAGIKGTPTIFVNGKQLPGGQFLPILNRVYNSLKKNH